MHHFFTPPELLGDAEVRLEGEEARHAARALRVSPGEEISVADGSGRVVRATVTSAAGDAVTARVVARWDRALPRPELVLYQALVRKEKMELCVQKAVEVGARRIVPLVCERTVVRWDEGKRERHRGRWTEIARAAAKQCRSPWLAEVEPFAEGIGRVSPPEALLVLDAEAETSFRKALPEGAPDSLGVVVGPEGGLTTEEVLRLEAVGGVPTTLGERILRAETAGPVALALAGYVYGLFG